jgi:hypothetical protein
MDGPRRFFVKIIAPDRRTLIALGKMELDLFGHTTVAQRVMAAGVPAESLEIDGLLGLSQIETLVLAGYRVTVEDEASQRARSSQTVIEFEQWLKEMGEK